MRKTDSKKLLSGLLVLCMLFSMLPLSVAAEGEQGTAKFSVTAGAADLKVAGTANDATYSITNDATYSIIADTTIVTLEPEVDYKVPASGEEPEFKVIAVDVETTGKDITSSFKVTYGDTNASLILKSGENIYDIRSDVNLINITVANVFVKQTYAINEVKIDGTARVGETLTAVVDPEDATVEYQWYRGATEEDGAFTAISGATGKTYPLTTADEHQYIYVAVKGTGNYAGQEDASGTVYVAAENEKLTVDGVTIISDDEEGAIKVGAKLTAEVRANGSVIGDAEQNVTYLWQSSDTKTGKYTTIISSDGETADLADYTPTENDLGKYIQVVVAVTENNEKYEGGATSKAVGPVANEEGNVVIDGVELEVEEVEATEEIFEATAGKVTGANQDAVKAAVAVSKVEVTEKMAKVMQEKGFEILTDIMRTEGRLKTLLQGAGLAGNENVTKLEARTEIKPEPQSCSATQYVLDITPWIKVYATIEGEVEAKELPGAATKYTEEIPGGVLVTIGVPSVLIGNVNNKTIYVTHQGEARQTLEFDPATETTVTITVPHFSNFTVATTGGGGGGGTGGGGGGGGSSSSSSSTVNVSSTTNGTVTVSPKDAKKGDTVTITAKPNSGYVVGSVTVTDKNGDSVRVTAASDGTYTFVMPEASPVTVKVEFVKETPATPTVSNPFYDVPSGAYYYDAVLWAIENNITAGMTATSFGPNEPCTRAQIVTFLWRAAGSPRATGSNPFTDISASEYYYDAVLWAVANGITAGTTSTTFSPTETCTRAQAVSFLYRAKNSPATSGTNSFTDLASGAYYTSAVQWAVNTGVTAGTTNTTFSPDQNCTRAQIVSFLYRDRAG